jgi:DNA-binding transcriptional MocR family regulator
VADSSGFVLLARRHGVHVAPGSICMAGRVPGPFVRICVDRPPDLITEGCARLGRAWREARANAPVVAG